MNLLIVSATEFEIAPFLQQNKNTEVLITGVGIPATIFHLTKKLIEKKFDCVIQAGIAGSFSKTIDPTEVFFVKEDTFADIGIDENGIFKDFFDNHFLDKNSFPFSNGWLVNNHFNLDKNKFKKASAVTINKITDDKNQIEKIKEIDFEKIKVELEKVKPEMEKSMQKAKESIEKAKVEIKEYQSFVNALTEDGLIKKGEPYTIEIKEDGLIINGKKQPEAVYNKHRAFLEKHKGTTIKKTADDLNIHKD